MNEIGAKNMVVKVLGRGVLPKEKAARETCPYCQSELEFKKSDCRRAEVEILWFRYYYLNCPVCGKVTDWKNAKFIHEQKL